MAFYKATLSVQIFESGRQPVVWNHAVDAGQPNGVVVSAHIVIHCGGVARCTRRNINIVNVLLSSQFRDVAMHWPMSVRSRHPPSLH
jgi:hypothetical protein